MNKWYAVDHDDAILKNWMAGIKQVTGHPDPSEYDHWDNIKLTPTTNSISVRGMTNHKIIHECWRTKRPFYYVDTGYIGNNQKRKEWHRVIRNNVQHQKLVDVPANRLVSLQQSFPELKWKGWRKDGGAILLVTPSPKPCRFYNVDRDTWVEDTIATLKKYTDREIIVRDKVERRKRVGVGHIFSQIKNDNIYALVTYQSIGAIEGIIAGVPAFTGAPTAADPVSNHDLANIENPKYSDEEEIWKWQKWLAYCQYTSGELSNGNALRILQEIELE